MTTDSTRDETMDVERDAIYWKERYEIERGEVAPLQQALQQARAERDALAFRVSALREGLQDVLGVDPRSDAMWFIADNALKVDDDRARQALTSMERGQNAG